MIVVFARAGGRVWGSGGFELGGRGQCWVGATEVSARYMLAIFFITISHCARVISVRTRGFRAYRYTEVPGSV